MARNVNGGRQARKESGHVCSPGRVGPSDGVRDIGGERSNDAQTVWGGAEHRTAAAPGDVRSVDEVATRDGIDQANPAGKEAEPIPKEGGVNYIFI